MKMTLATNLSETNPGHRWTRQQRSLLAACLTHALHDGYTDGLYAFLPVWQAQFGLSYAALAVVRALYYGTMGGLQIPTDRALRGLSPQAALILPTVTASAGLLIMALPFSFAGLCVDLVVAGIGSSIQHPRGSTLVTGSYGEASRRPLGIYNFSGDLGKAVLPALIAVLLPILAWRSVLGLMAALGIALAVALVFIGGAFGKATCGWLGERLGVVGSVIVTEVTTALLIVATLITPLTPTLILLPLLGIVLNGTSSVLYGTVPELSKGDTSRVFAVFHTSVIGSGGIPLRRGCRPQQSDDRCADLGDDRRANRAACRDAAAPPAQPPEPPMTIWTEGS